MELYFYIHNSRSKRLALAEFRGLDRCRVVACGRRDRGLSRILVLAVLRVL